MNALQILQGREYKDEGGGQYSCRCPAHDDHNASLAVKQVEGRVLFHCFAGCTFKEIMRGFGIEGEPLGPSKAKPEPKKVMPPLSVNQEGLERLTREQRTYMNKERCISDWIQRSVGMKMYGDRYALPIWGNGIEDIRLWLPPEKRTKGTPKITSWKRGYGGSRLYPIDSTDGGPKDVILCAGELDALALLTLGYPGLTTTGSESSFPLRLAQQMHSLGVRSAHILLDADSTGIKGSILRKHRLEEVGIYSSIIEWPSDRPKGWDITDEIKDKGNLGSVL